MAGIVQGREKSQFIDAADLEMVRPAAGFKTQRESRAT
jgi:hypothetical protein